MEEMDIFTLENEEFFEILQTDPTEFLIEPIASKLLAMMKGETDEMNEKDIKYINDRLNEMEDLLDECRKLEEDLLEYISRYI